VSNAIADVKSYLKAYGPLCLSFDAADMIDGGQPHGNHAALVVDG
jgi:hypothetical protein